MQGVTKQVSGWGGVYKKIPLLVFTVQAGQYWRGGEWLRADVYAACSRRGQFSRRSSIQCDEISCIRDHLKYLLSELQIIIPKTDRNGVCIQ